MILSDFLKRVTPNDMHRMMIYKDPNGGWTNVSISIEGEDIVIRPDRNEIFSDDLPKGPATEIAPR